MVYMPGKWKMAALRTFLSENYAEEPTHENVSERFKCREFFDIDEPNLLDENDMIIFGCRPMTDPLDLVSCNVCEKPIKASQYAKHAELCSSPEYIKDKPVTSRGDLGHKKPPKKGKKFVPSSNDNPKIRIKVREKHITVVTEGGSSAHGMCENRNDLLSRATATQASFVGVDNAEPILSTKVSAGDGSAPLATKIYYSQSNNLLRLELGRLYYDSCAKESPNNFAAVNLVHEKVLTDFQDQEETLSVNSSRWQSTESPYLLQQSGIEMQTAANTCKVVKSEKNAVCVQHSTNSGPPRTKQLANGRVPTT